MGTIINLGKFTYSWDRENGYKVDTNHSGLTLSDTGWKNFNITKHRRGWRNNCVVCGKKCCQALGNQYQQICLKCSSEWIANSIEELDRIKAKLKEQKELITKNWKNMMDIEKEKIDDWAKMDMLDKFESEE